MHQLMGQTDGLGHSRLRWSRPKLVHVRFNSDSDRQPSKRDPALRAKNRLMQCNIFHTSLDHFLGARQRCLRIAL